MGISYGDFWQMTLREILNAQKGYLERTYNDWRRTRWLGAIFANVFSKKDVKPSDLLKLPGDDSAPDFTDEIKQIKERREQVKKNADGK